MNEMLSTYENCHKWQNLEMQGPDLAKKHQKQILAHTSETPLNWIKEINKLHFEIQLTSLEKNMKLIY